MGPAVSKFETGHSLKRGCVTLLRIFSMEDEDVMTWIKMDGVRTFPRYTEAFNDSAPPPLPHFCTLEAMEVHMEGMQPPQIYTINQWSLLFY